MAASHNNSSAARSKHIPVQEIPAEKINIISSKTKVFILGLGNVETLETFVSDVDKVKVLCNNRQFIIRGSIIRKALNEDKKWN
jgi:hypothetical protein